MVDAIGSVALVTVTSTDFLPGTVVLLHSFLQHNDWFEGDIVIIQDDLEPRSIEILEQSFERIKFISPSPSLVKRLDLLVEANPGMERRKARFYSLESIGLNQYNKLLFCDSDLLFRSSVQPLFESDEPLIVCGDGPFFRGNARNSTSFGECPKSGADNELDQCFNAGFMIMDKTVRTKENYDALIGMIDVDFWKNVETMHTDQLLYNIYFDGQQSLVNSKYNFMMLHRKDIFRKFETRLEDACVIHYNGPAKPWLPSAVLANFKKDPALIPALKYWNDSFADFLAQKSVMMAV